MRSPSPTPLRLMAALLGGLAWLCGACASESRPAAEGWSGQLVPLELAPVGERETPPPRIVERLHPPEGLAPWTSDAQTAVRALVPVGRGDGELPGFTLTDGVPHAPAAVLLGRGARSLSVPVAVEPGSVNQVALRLSCPTREELTVACYSADTLLERSVPLVFLGADAPRTVVFDLPGLRRHDAAADRLTVEIDGRAGGMVVFEIALAWRSPASLWPAAGSPAPIGLVDATADLRRGVALAGGAPLRAGFTVPPGASLRFAWGWPEALQTPGTAPEFSVEVATEDGRAASARFALVGEAHPVWREATVDLSGLAGATAEARFTLTDEAAGARGLEPVALVAEPRLERAGGWAPSVLLVTSDTHRADHLGVALDEPLVSTPAIDALAGRGVLFEDAFAAANVTNPSHASLLTGLHVRDTRVTDNASPLVDGVSTLAGAFRGAGYRTFAALSTRHLVHDESGLGQGFERMDAPADSERSAEATIRQLSRWLPDAEGVPLFVWLHLFDAHSPYEPRGEFDRRYYPPGADPFDPSRALEYSGRMLPLYLKGLTDVHFPHAQYRAEVDYLDAQLAGVFSLPRFAAGIVAFTSDHGESFGQHGVWWDHAELYPDSVHVPLVLAWPGAPGGTRSAAPVRQMDLGRTLLDLAGLTGAPFPGRDLRSVLDGGSADAPRFAIATDGESAAINSDGWHLILHLRDHHQTALERPRERHRVELYHTVEDPACTRDLVASEPDRARRLRAALLRWLAAGSGEGLARAGGATRAQLERLEAMGYTGGASPAPGGSWFGESCDCAWCDRLR
ncbi:MAG: sulfatase [Planctomycetota bacterium]|nr:sulfatase [Planctomycetota bacterium]MDP6988763.1 sulfatase [Planctomycetota bacterium]